MKFIGPQESFEEGQAAKNRLRIWNTFCTRNYIILLVSQRHKLRAIGDETGIPFPSQRETEKWAKQYRKAYPHLEVLVLRVDPAGRSDGALTQQ